MLAFGKSESYTIDMISYKENIDMLLNDLKSWGYKDLTKADLLDVFNEKFSIGRAVRMEISRILDNRE